MLNYSQLILLALTVTVFFITYVHILHLNNVGKLSASNLAREMKGSVKDYQGSTIWRHLYALNVAEESKIPLLSNVSKHKISLFNKKALTEREFRMMANVMKTFHDVMTNASLQYFLYAGTLLGSYRHHGMIPWDDDLDVMVNLEDKHKIQQAFENCPAGYKLVYFNWRFKFFHEAGHPVRDFNYLAPYMDVTFYKDNATHLWDMSLREKQKPFLKTLIFPLRIRPYLGHLFYAPRDPRSFLQDIYKIDQCYTGQYSHLNYSAKSWSQIGEIPCSALIDYVPFINHVRGPGGSWCEEILTFRGQVLNTFIRSSSDIPNC